MIGLLCRKILIRCLMDYCLCAPIYVPKFPLNAVGILIFLDITSFVLMNEKIGLSYLCIGFLNISLIVVTKT